MSKQSAFGAPVMSARIKAAPEDFIVEEIAGFAPSGSGEHLLLSIEKRELTTSDVAQRLCSWAKVAPVAIGFAGMKDKHAITRQRFTVHLPKRVAPELATLEGDGLMVLSSDWHSRKLPRGGLAGNAFTLTLRDVRAADAAATTESLHAAVGARLSAFQSRGVPNRFGVQRFGRFGDNVGQARRMFAGAKVGREQRSMLLSAVRSDLFNRVLEARVLSGTWDKAIEGEVFMLDGRKSVFGPELLTPELHARIEAFDIHPTGPLWGRGALRSTADALALEAAIAAEEPMLCQGLEQAGLEQERRSLRLRPEHLAWRWLADDCLELKFQLPPGCYATAVLAELCGETGEGAITEGE